MKVERITSYPGRPPITNRPYCLGTVAEGKFLFISGHGPYCPEADGFVRGTLEEQTTLALRCLQRVAEAAGGDIQNAMACRVYLQQLTEKNFKAMNTAYEAFFGENKPARTTVGCQLLNIDVEIEAIVALG